MGKDVKILSIVPELVQDQPVIVGKYIAQQMAESPDAFGVVLIGSREDVKTFSQNALFMYGDVEEIKIAS